MRIASLPLQDTFCPLCGAALRLPSSAEWPTLVDGSRRSDGLRTTAFDAAQYR
jgi:hypothetical protein